MSQQNQNIVNKFFEAYFKHDRKALQEIVHENVTWYFMGNHPLAGVKNGLTEVIAFFDTMGNYMKQGNPAINKLIVAENENYLIECQQIIINRPDGININHHVAVLWTFENGKIISGRHFFADSVAADKYFKAIVKTL